MDGITGVTGAPVPPATGGADAARPVGADGPSVAGRQTGPDGTPASPPEAGRRGLWRSTGSLVGLIALLSAGWPLFNAALPGGESLAAGHELVLTAAAGRAAPEDAESGEGTGSPPPTRPPTAVLTVPDEGWTLSRPATIAGTRYQLHHQDVRLTARYVPLGGPEEAATLWSGLDAVTRAADRGATLGAPESRVTAGGVDAQSGALRQSGCQGTATTLLAPDRTAAVAVTLLDCGGGDGGSGEGGEAGLRQGLELIERMRFTAPESAGSAEPAERVDPAAPAEPGERVAPVEPVEPVEPAALADQEPEAAPRPERGSGTRGAEGGGGGAEGAGAERGAQERGAGSNGGGSSATGIAEGGEAQAERRAGPHPEREPDAAGGTSDERVPENARAPGGARESAPKGPADVEIRTGEREGTQAAGAAAERAP